MASGYTAVDLSQLEAPQVVETLSFEAIVAAMIADLQSRDSTFDALVESDPAYKIIEVSAYREVLLRQRVNEAAKAVMLAYATGTDLDQLAALFGVTRLVIDEGDADATPPIDPTYEADANLRKRVQLSLEALSVAGPEGAYVYHAVSADGDVLDASATSPSPGEVVISVLSRTGSGTASADLLAAVNNAVSADDVRPLTDHVTVQSATIINYSIDATIRVFSGPDRSVVMAAAQAAIETYVEAQHAIGRDITLSGIYAALHQPGVQNVTLTAPAASIVVDRTSASYCTAITLTDGGTDE